MQTILVCVTIGVLGLVSTATAIQNLALDKRAQELLQKSQKLLHQGQTAEAQVLIKQARELQITLAKQYKRLGQEHTELGQWNAAQIALRNALKHNYNDPTVHRDLGRILLRKKHYKDALSSLSKSLELDANIAHTHHLLDQAVRGYYNTGLAKSFKQYTFPCQAIAFQEAESLRVEIAYALPKVGLTRAGGIGVVHIDQILNFVSPELDHTQVTKHTHLPEYGQSTLAKNYLFGTHVIRIPSQTTSLQLTIKDRNIGSVGKYATPIHPIVTHTQFGLSTPLLAQSIQPRKDHPQTRNDLKITPNPLRLYKANTPVFIYLEIYNLLPTAWGLTNFELSYHIQWPADGEIEPNLFEALDTELSENVPESSQILQYLIPTKHRQNITPSQTHVTNSATSITIPYTGQEINDRTYLQIDTSHLPPGIHKLILTGKDLVSEESATQTTLFRIVP